MIIVEVKNVILGDSEFWRGPEEKISEIRNIPARMASRPDGAGYHKQTEYR